MNSTAIAARSEVVAPAISADRNPAAVYLASLGAGSVRAQRTALDKVARLILAGAPSWESIDWTVLRYQHVALVKSLLIKEGLAAATVNRILSALKGVVREGWRLGFVDAEELRRVEDVKSEKVQTLPAGRALSMAEVQTLGEACDTTTPGGARDAAMLAILFGAGLRREELVTLDLADYNPRTGELRIKGKGNKERLAYATNGSSTALAIWLTHRGTEPGPLFSAVNRWGRVAGKRMSTQAVYGALLTLAQSAGVAKFSPHDLRRTFISELLDRGADLSAVKDLAGHSSVTTTTRYDRRGERARRKAAELLHFPFKP